MHIGHAAILGLVEGVTEYLPISSTGHLILTARLLGLGQDADPAAQAAMRDAVDTFTIVIQGGAILAVAGLYRRQVIAMLRGVLGRDPAGLRLALLLFIAFLPAAVLGPLLKRTITAHLFHVLPVLLALGVGGIVLILLTPWQRRHFEAAPETRRYVTIATMSLRAALIIGVLQCVAMWPGTSRSMMTIIGGMVIGLRPREAAEFSFLLGLPTLGGACAYELLGALRSDAGMFASLGWPAVITGLVVAFISATVAVRWLVGYLSTHGVAIFGWYRLLLCAVMAAFVAGGFLEIGGA